MNVLCGKPYADLAQTHIPTNRACISPVASSPDEILYNKEIGHLLRTKNVVHRDGGVASGRANLDSPLLTSWPVTHTSLLFTFSKHIRALSSWWSNYCQEKGNVLAFLGILAVQIFHGNQRIPWVLLPFRTFSD